jgi:hypothetical protein
VTIAMFAPILSLVLGSFIYSTHAIPCSLGVLYFCIGFHKKNLGCKDDLYLVMIETHIKENQKFHKLFP